MHEQKPIEGGDKHSEKKVILLHGRGGDAQDLMNFAERHLPPAHFIALQADNNEWYPNTFMAPRADNEPHLSAALEAIKRAITQTKAKTENIFLLGFSQGACLAAEYAARNPTTYGGILVFSGGLIGEEILPPEESLEDTPMVFGCSKNDPHIPLGRVMKSIEAFSAQDAKVIEYLYPGNSHTITDPEILLARSLIGEN